MTSNPYQNQYRANQIMTASPQQLVLMLYDRGLRDINQAAEAIEAKDLMSANKHLQHLEDIWNELVMGLDFNQGEMANDLARLYDYYIVRTREANVTKDVAILNELREHLTGLRQTWADAMLKAKQEASGGVPDHV